MESWLDISIASIALLIFSAASLAEASHLRKQRLTIRELLDNGSATSNSENAVDETATTRSAIDVAALIAVLVFGIVTARLGLREFGWGGALFAIGLGAGVIVIFGRMLPNAIAERFNIAESWLIQSLGVILAGLVTPVTLLADAGAAGLSRLFGARGSGNGDLVANGTNGQANGQMDVPFDSIEEDEHEMISGILRMEDATAREIMVPRPDVIAVPAEMSITEVVSVAQQAGHSRIPVYSESIDRVQGVVYAKDLLRFVTEDVESIRLSDMVRPAMFVPESKRVDDLLRDLRRSKVHLAVVVDEYGGTAGIVTIEDILEEIVGEIQDEYDRELPLYQFGSTGEVTVDGRMGVEDLSELIGVDLPETESETLGGFVQRQLGRIPEPGETVQAGEVAIRVESVERRRVRTLRVSRLERPDSIDTTDPLRAT